jgi:hypothetical protein
MDPEGLAAVVDTAADEYVDEAVAESADQADEGTDQQEPDPVEQAFTSEAGQARMAREKTLHTNQVAKLFDRYADGDNSVLAELQADKNGRRILRADERKTARLQAQFQVQAPQEVVAQQEHDRLARLEVEDPYLFAEEMKIPGKGKWFYNDWPGYKAQQEQVRRTPRQQFDETTLDRFVERLLSRDSAKGLTPAERDELDPIHFDDLDTDDAQVAITERFALIQARKTAKREVAPTEARRREQARLADAVAAGMAADAPNVAGRPAGRLSESQVIQAFSDAYEETGDYNRIPERIRTQYDEIRRRRGFVGT